MVRYALHDLFTRIYVHLSRENAEVCYLLALTYSNGKRFARIVDSRHPQLFAPASL